MGCPIYGGTHAFTEKRNRLRAAGADPGFEKGGFQKGDTGGATNKYSENTTRSQLQKAKKLNSL